MAAARSAARHAIAIAEAGARTPVPIGGVDGRDCGE